MPRIAPIAVVALLAVGSGCREHAGANVAPDATPRPRSNLSVRRVELRSHAYLVFEQRPPAVRLSLARPHRDDPALALAIAGTYTSPEGRVEGAFVLDGVVAGRDVKPWEGLLVVRGGKPVVSRRTLVAPSDAELIELAGPEGSLLQGHLLVAGGVRPLKASPALRRRALATREDGAFFIAESLVALPLAEFAVDLHALGARAALNLDMGEWSEGFYRDPASGELRTLGDDHRKTARQTNWLVLLAK